MLLKVLDLGFSKKEILFGTYGSRWSGGCANKN